MASSESDESKKPELYVDDDWKSRVKAEDAALDEKFRDEGGEAKQAEPPPADESAEGPGELPPLPAADFSILVGMLSTQAFVSLGLIPNPATGKAEVQLELAKHMIDLLGVLEDKTKGNLEQPEQQLLDETLHQLRMVYVQQSKTAAGDG